MGLLTEFLSRSNMKGLDEPTGIGLTGRDMGRMAAKAIPGMAGMRRNQFYQHSDYVDRSFDRGRESRNREEVKQAMKELMNLPLHAMEEADLRRVTSEVFNKFPTLTPQQQQGMIGTLLQNQNFFSDREWDKEQREQTRQGWKNAALDRVRANVDRKRTWKLEDEESLRKGFARARENVTATEKQKLSQEKWETEKKLIEAQTNRLKRGTVPKPTKITEAQIGRKKKVMEAELFRSGIDIFGALTPEQIGKLVKIVDKHGFRANIYGNEVDSITWKDGPAGEGVADQSVGAGQDLNAEFQKYVTTGKGGAQEGPQPKPKPEPEPEPKPSKTQATGSPKLESKFLKGGSADVSWDFTDVRNFLQWAGITNKNVMSVVKEALTQANWTWDFFLQRPWNEVEKVLIDAVKQQGAMRKKAGL